MNEPEPCLPLILPPRYRLRDLILGDYAFNDDGEREILIMQAPVPECSESEDDEVDNDPPLTAPRSDSGTVSS
ncbi:hypothetical protein ALC53_07861 [Atta colombica]|uniref:Uncharacterized protein n=1 Tax=Atta colombica TaxID=520822 RepID=A0A195BAY9_9HYME|nr:hypothetical protein ALC53_07861 [Atta colombica]